MVGAGLFVLIDPPAKWSITGPPTSGIHNAVNPSTSNSAATSAIWAGPRVRHTFENLTTPVWPPLPGAQQHRPRHRSPTHSHGDDLGGLWSLAVPAFAPHLHACLV